MAKVTSTKRIEKNLVEPIPMREALINAIVHSDFSREIPPVFEIFSDRMVFTSYGGLIPGQSEQNFFSCSSMSRNRELMRVFKDVGLVGQLGSGMSRILKVYDKNIFKISEHFIKVEFPFSVTKDIAINDNNKEHGKGNIGNTQDNTQDNTRDNIQVKILEFCEKPRSKKEIAAYMGYKDAKSFAKRYLIPLYDNGKIQMTIPEHPTSKNQKYVTVK